MDLRLLIQWRLNLKLVVGASARKPLRQSRGGFFRGHPPPTVGTLYISKLCAEIALSAFFKFSGGASPALPPGSILMAFLVKCLLGILSHFCIFKS